MITETITCADVEDALEAAGVGPYIREDSEGRLAIYFETNADMIAFIVAVAHLAGARLDDAPEWLRDVQTTREGLGHVATWPRVALG